MRFIVKAGSSVPLALLTAYVLCACGSSPSATSSPPGPTVTAIATRPGCDLAPASLVTAELGVAAGDPRATTTTLVTVCTYTVGSNPSGVTIRFQIHEDHAGYSLGKSAFSSTSDISGVGDEAYSAVIASYTTLVSRKGTVEILLTAKAGLAAEKALVLILLSKV